MPRCAPVKYGHVLEFVLERAAGDGQGFAMQEWLKLLRMLMGRAGFEPATLGLKVPCSTS